MTDFTTVVIVKNIPSQELENLLRQTILENNILNETQDIKLSLKNSRTLVVSFPKGISFFGFESMAKKLLEYHKNEISLSEIIAIYNNKIEWIQSKNFKLTDSIHAILSFYKLDKGVLHEIFTLNKANCQPKKWWQFWK